MSAIPISPSAIAGAIPYPVQGSAVPCSIADKPPEGHKYLPMQIGFADAPVKLVDLSSITPTQKFSKISSLYIDATNSTHDITILFPDTGFSSRVAFGDTALLPVLTSNASPRFYVILDSGNQTNATDIANIFAINFFIPPVATSIYQRSISYGYGEMAQILPVLAQSTNFCSTINANNSGTLINAHQWYLTSLNINTILTSIGTNNGYSVTLFDNGVPIFQYGGAVSGEQGFVLTDVAGLNFVSSGNGPLTANLSGALASGSANFNVGGGILVS